MKEITTKRLIGWLMAFVMLIPSVALAKEPPVLENIPKQKSNDTIEGDGYADFYAYQEYLKSMPMLTGTVYHNNEKLIIQVKKEDRIQYMTFKGIHNIANFAPTQVGWKNPVTGNMYQAYCVNPEYNGYSTNNNERYNLDIEKYDIDCLVDEGKHSKGKKSTDKSAAGNTIYDFLEGAVNYGFPTVPAATLLGGSAESFGVTQAQLDYAAYLATKSAIWSGIHNAYKIVDWAPNPEVSNKKLSGAVVQATKNIYNKAGTYKVPPIKNTVTFIAETPKKNDHGEYEVIFSIDKTQNNVQGSDMFVEMAKGGTFPTELKITTESGTELQKKTTSTGTERYVVPYGTAKIKAVFPDPGKGNEYSGELRLMAQQTRKILLYARSLKDKRQNYILAGNAYDNPSAAFRINSDGTPEIPPEIPPDSSNPPPDTPIIPPGKLKVVKRDARDQKTPLEGVTFDCYDAQGHLIDTGTTNSTGEWIPKIPGAGTYTIIERTNNIAYQYTEPTSMVVTVLPDGEATATFLDYPSTTVVVEKEDAHTGQPIPGVEYLIEEIDGKGAWKATGKTEADGKITWNNVPDGTYTVKEVSTTDGYLLDPTPQTVTVCNGQAPSLKFTNSKIPGLTIVKLDRQTGEKVTAEATFRVEQINGTFQTDITTENGVATLDKLSPGSYKITELSAPEGYVIDGCAGTIHLNPGENRQYYAYDLKKPILTIRKIDGKTGKPIPGTKFEVKKSDGTKIGVVETGENGEVTIGMKGHELGYLEPDTYTVTEIFVPEPYELAKEHQDIQLKAGDKKSIVFDNMEKPIITVVKYDEKDPSKLLSNAQFAIYEQHDLSRPVAEGVTNKDGKFTTGYISPGTYVVQELNPPPGYMFSDKTESRRTIIAKAGDGEIIVKVDNIKLPELTIEKVDAVTKKPIAGVVYEVKQVDDTSVQPSTATTDENGKIVLPNLKAGTYEVTEISTPQHYILNTKSQRVKLKAGDMKKLRFENILYPTLVIQKTDGTTYKGIPNTTYRIEHRDEKGGISTVGTFKTDKDGRIVLPYVEPGWYIITETIPAQGYQKPSNPVTEIYLKPGENSYPSQDNHNSSTENNSQTVPPTVPIIPPDTSDNSDTSKEPNKPNISPDKSQEVSDLVQYAPDFDSSKVVVQSGDAFQKVDEIVNYPLNSIVIKKSDANTGEMLEGAVFEVIRISGETTGQNGKLICTVNTNHSGTIVITGLEAGAYAIREIKAPQNYIIDETDMQTVNLKADSTSIVEVLFRNSPYGAISIQKVDGDTRKPLEGAKFKVTDSSGAVFGKNSYVSDANGNILVESVPPGSYVVTEIEAPEGYEAVTEPQTIVVGTEGKTADLTFTNYKKGNLLIRKFDADTKEPLAGAKFKVTESDGTAVGTNNGIYTTDETGVITLPLLKKGTYNITEMEAPEGYAISENATQTIKVNHIKTYTVDFYNKKKGNLLIRKFDAATKEPLSGAKFKVEQTNGTVIGTSNGIYTTDESGIITLPLLKKGTYVVTEIEPPKGYALSDKPSQIIEIDNIKTYTLDFYNKKKQGLQIIKVDSQTRKPLPGAEFQIWNVGASTSTSVSGSSPAGNLVGTYTTNENGVINMVLDAGTYEILETKAPKGYQVDNHKQDVVIRDGEQTSVTFTNTKFVGLEITKVDADTKAPLQGAVFEVKKPNGELIGTYTTDAHGYIMVSELTSGTYVVSEKNAPAGYVLDSIPQTVEVKAGVAKRVTFENRKKGGVVIQKQDSVTKRPIEGCEFLITAFDGTKVGTFTTDHAGQIHLPNLTDGTYIAKETKAPLGYNLAAPKSFQVTSGKNRYMEGVSNEQTVTIYNDPLGVSQIIKTDAVTGKPVAGATYVISALNNGTGQYSQTVIAAGANASNIMVNGLHTVIGRYTTSENGIINISNLPEGWYTLQEETAPSGYERDATVYDFQITGNGAPTIIRLTNKPIMGRIALTKLSQDYNNNTGWDRGTPLAGAVYSVLDQDGIEVDRMTTGDDGSALSKPLKIGSYFLKEVKAPDWYGINPKLISVTIKRQGQVVAVTAKDKSVNLRVGIKKTSDTKTCSWGDTIHYYITGVGNESNVALDKFTVHDKLPDTKAAKIKFFDTGLWNKKYQFKVAYTTNLSTAYTYLPGLYSSDKHNHIDLYAGNMGLRKGEYVTQIKMEFQGSVAPGFKLLEAISAEMIAGNNLPNGYQFTNYADVSGRWHEQVVTANSHWTITMYGKPAPKKPPQKKNPPVKPPKFPKTGW